MLAFIGACEVRLLSRNTLDQSRRLAPVTEALRSLHSENAIIDGTVCVLGPGGRSDAAALEALVEQGAAPLSYLAFDILWLNGEEPARGPVLLSGAIRLRK